jgi:hypothetical protein
MKTYQFLGIIGMLFLINSNVTENMIASSCFVILSGGTFAFAVIEYFADKQKK